MNRWGGGVGGGGGARARARARGGGGRARGGGGFESSVLKTDCFCYNFIDIRLCCGV